MPKNEERFAESRAENPACVMAEAAWNFVVAGLLAVLLRPLLEGLGELKLGPAHLLFLAGALAVPVLNYLPTRLAPAALAFAIASAALARLYPVPIRVPGERSW